MTNAKFYELKRAINLGALSPAQAVELFEYAEKLRNLLREDIDGCGLWFPSEEVVRLVGLDPGCPPVQPVAEGPGVRTVP